MTFNASTGCDNCQLQTVVDSLNSNVSVVNATWHSCMLHAFNTCATCGICSRGLPQCVESDLTAACLPACLLAGVSSGGSSRRRSRSSSRPKPRPRETPLHSSGLPARRCVGNFINLIQIAFASTVYPEGCKHTELQGKTSF